MSATNRTTNYNLPQFVATDVPTWLTDVNGAMSTIDTSIKGVADSVTVARGETSAVNARVDATNANVSTLAQSVTTAEQNIATLQQGLGVANSNITANTQKIGTATLDTVAQTLSGAVNELNEATKYKSGDVIVLPNAVPYACIGTLTSGRKEVNFIINLPKEIEDGLTVTAEGTITIRGVAGNIGNANTNLTSYTGLSVDHGISFVRIKVTSSNELTTTTTNNTPVFVQLGGNFTLRFN